jgi:flagellar protein FlaF
MNSRPQAPASPYSAVPVRTERGTEYDIFARITQRLKALDEAYGSTFPALALGVYDNKRLWSTL